MEKDTINIENRTNTISASNNNNTDFVVTRKYSKKRKIQCNDKHIIKKRKLNNNNVANMRLSDKNETDKEISVSNHRRITRSKNNNIGIITESNERQITHNRPKSRGKKVVIKPRTGGKKHITVGETVGTILSNNSNNNRINKKYNLGIGNKPRTGGKTPRTGGKTVGTITSNNSNNNKNNKRYNLRPKKKRTYEANLPPELSETDSSESSDNSTDQIAFGGGITYIGYHNEHKYHWYLLNERTKTYLVEKINVSREQNKKISRYVLFINGK